MRRLLPVGLALAFAFCAYAIQSVQLPGRVLACSCVPPRPLAEMAADPSAILVVATVGQTFGADFEAPTALQIERIFTGEVPAQINVQGIGIQGAACQLGASQGDRLILSVYRGPSGAYSVSLCGIGAALGTPSGDALLAEAIDVFGEGQEPPSPPPQESAPFDPAPWIGGLGWVAALLAASMVVFGAVVLVALRRRPG